MSKKPLSLGETLKMFLGKVIPIYRRDPSLLESPNFKKQVAALVKMSLDKVALRHGEAGRTVAKVTAKDRKAMEAQIAKVIRSKVAAAPSTGTEELPDNLNREQYLAHLWEAMEALPGAELLDLLGATPAQLAAVKASR